MATSAAAVIAAARRRVERQFFDKDAFSPDWAIAIDTPRFAQQRFLDQLKDENVVHEIEPGRYWLDLKAYEEMRRARMIAGVQDHRPADHRDGLRRGRQQHAIATQLSFDRRIGRARRSTSWPTKSRSSSAVCAKAASTGRWRGRSAD